MTIPIHPTRRLLVPGDRQSTITFAVEHLTKKIKQGLEVRPFFCLALSGGSTPKAIYQGLAKEKGALDWRRVKLFFSDERTVPPTHEESNYRMAIESGLKELPIPKEQIYRMEGELPPLEAAERYDQLLKRELKGNPLDFVMLGMGPDGHTASLFPYSEGLKDLSHLSIANYVKEKNTFRLSLSFLAINQARSIVVYVLGKEKASILTAVFTPPDDPMRFPIQAVGTKECPALFIADTAAAEALDPMADSTALKREDLNLQKIKKAKEIFERFRTDMKDDRDEAGAIQAFDFCFELAWKVMKFYLEEQGVETGSPKDVFRKAAVEKLIRDPELWFVFQKKRVDEGI